MRRILLMVLLIATIPAPALAESDPEEWLYRSEVVFDASKGWQVRLVDGREMLIGWWAQPSCEGTRQWESGRALVYAYRPDVGSVLIDSQTGCRMGVALPNPHPIDLIDDLPAGRTRYGLWDAELNRVYKLAMETLERSKGGDGVLPGPEVAKALRDSQRRWIAFRDAEAAALEKLHSGNGEVGEWQEYERRIDLVRQRTRALAHYVLTER